VTDVDQGQSRAHQITTQSLPADLLVVRLNRPEKRNALTRPIIEQLTQGIVDAGSQAVRGIVLAGEGPSFCAGVDLHEFANGTAESIRALMRALRDCCAAVRRLPQPVCCAIQGYCLGGALELAACCDFRVCTPDASLGMPEVSLGIPSVIDAVMLQHLIGIGRAHEMLLTGDTISGETAHEWGLVNRLAPESALIESAAALLRRVIRHDREAIAAQKALHEQWLDLTYRESVEHSMESLVDAFRSGRPQRLAAKRLGGA
jgi:enoyl-CoA hydratase